MQPTLTDIYTALRDSVRFYPRQELPCEQPQTWRVLQESLGVEVQTTTLGATICDKDKPFFYSRLWEEKKYSPNAVSWNFPMLYAFEIPSVVKDLLGGAPQFIYTIEMGVIDVLSDDKAGRSCTGCNSRTINEINETTQGILQACLEYLKNTYQYSVDGGAAVWANKTFIEQGIAAQRFDATRIGPGITDKSQSINQEAPFFRIGRMGNIYGIGITLRFYGDGCVTPEWNFNEIDFGVLAHEAGCLTC